jgi:hypothetical protein
MSLIYSCPFSHCAFYALHCYIDDVLPYFLHCRPEYKACAVGRRWECSYLLCINYFEQWQLTLCNTHNVNGGDRNGTQVIDGVENPNSLRHPVPRWWSHSIRSSFHPHRTRPESLDAGQLCSLHATGVQVREPYLFARVVRSDGECASQGSEEIFRYLVTSSNFSPYAS